jgi:hypothetical protein
MDRSTIRQVQFTCPHCKGTTLEEFTSCDGIESEIVGLSERGDVQYGDKIGAGDTYDVEYRCADCGQPIDCDCREDLLDLGYITLGGPVDPIIEAGFSATERGNVYLVRGDDHLAYYRVGFNVWIEVSVCPENYPATSCATVKMTDDELKSHCNNAVQNDGWEYVKNNLE